MTHVSVIVFLSLLTLYTGVSLFLLRKRYRKAMHRQHEALKLADKSIREGAQMNKKLQQALQKAEAASRAKSCFFASVSHEVRTPINAVVGFAEFLAEPEVPPPKRMEYARSIGASANSLLALVNDVLDLSKFESGDLGSLDIRTGATDVSALVDGISACLAPVAKKKGVALDVAGARTLGRLALSEARLRQILQNLVGNAITSVSSGSVRVSGSHDEVTRVLRLSIAVTSLDISPADCRRIFEPFMQDDPAHYERPSFGGGLGMSVTRRLVQASGGTLDVESLPGGGTVFKIVLPSVRRVEAADDEGPAAPAVMDGKVSRVLIVDDIAMNRKILTLYCKTLGVADVRACESAAAALGCLQSGFVPQVVLSDLMMPDMDGSELARRIAARWPSLPVVAVTADVDADDAYDVSAFRQVLTKPVRADDLKRLFASL